jgi:hypothetical protein
VKYLLVEYRTDGNVKTSASLTEVYNNIWLISVVLSRGFEVNRGEIKGTRAKMCSQKTVIEPVPYFIGL